MLLVLLAVGEDGAGTRDLVGSIEDAGAAGVLACQGVDLAEGAKGAVRDIAKVPDRGGDDIEGRGGEPGLGAGGGGAGEAAVQLGDCSSI